MDYEIVSLRKVEVTFITYTWKTQRGNMAEPKAVMILPGGVHVMPKTISPVLARSLDEAADAFVKSLGAKRDETGND